MSSHQAGVLQLTRFICFRKAGKSPFLRERVIPFGHTGYVAHFDIEDAATVSFLAVRHPLQDDYH